LAVQAAAYLLWRPAMLRWGTQGAEAVEALPGDHLVANPTLQSTRAITIDAPPELQDLEVGDRVPYGGGVYATVTELEPNRHLVAGEAFVLRPLPGNRTRLIVRSRGMGYISAAAQGAAADAPALTKAIAYTVQKVPGALLLARSMDVLIGDPLHHYMEVGVLRGLKARAEGTLADGRGVAR
jgi:hypothetical protein